MTTPPDDGNGQWDDEQSSFPDPATLVASPLPGSTGGPIESVKTSMILALREQVSKSSLSINGSRVLVSMEYPMTKARTPGMWVQFGFSDFRRAGLGHSSIIKVGDDWQQIYEWMFDATVSVTVVAYTSIERDRLSDSFIQNIAFARPPLDYVQTQPAKNTRQFVSLFDSLNQNPYVFMTVNSDSLTPGGDGMSVGTPWDQNQFVYENTFSFGATGQFNVAVTDGLYTLARIDVTESQAPRPYQRGDWI